MRLEGRTAIVTGAAQGLGEAIAAGFLAEGARVVLADLDEGLARATSSRLDASGERVWAAALDVRSRDSIERVFDATSSRWGGVDVLVNNAARTVMRPFFEVEEREWDDVLAVNLRGVLFGCQIAGLHMRERGWGRIVNLTSLAGQAGSQIMGAHYSASKAGILALTKVAARELAPNGVTVNAIAPAAISGPTMDTLPPERVEALARSIPVGRIGRPNEVAGAAVYLASEEAGYVTGATLDVNGGQLMR